MYDLGLETGDFTLGTRDTTLTPTTLLQGVGLPTELLTTEGQERVQGIVVFASAFATTLKRRSRRSKL